VSDIHLFDWWPIIMGFTFGLVWLVRLEAKVIAARTAVDTVERGNEAWRAAHAAETAPQAKRIDEALTRLERGQREMGETLQDVRERVTKIEAYANGHFAPWDKTERRRGGGA
jgi:hypothetical protein